MWQKLEICGDLMGLQANWGHAQAWKNLELLVDSAKTEGHGVANRRRNHLRAD
jgi:hypothetical protein